MGYIMGKDYCSLKKIQKRVPKYFRLRIYSIQLISSKLSVNIISKEKPNNIPTNTTEEQKLEFETFPLLLQGWRGLQGNEPDELDVKEENIVGKESGKLVNLEESALPGKEN